MGSRPSEKEIEIARVYAQALLSLAAPKDESRSILEELEGLTGALDLQPALDRFLESPLVDAGERAAQLDRMFRGRLSDLLLDTLQVMNRKGRSNLLRALAVAYLEELEEREGIVEVHVRTAVPLSADATARLREAATRFSGKRVRLLADVDEGLIGGMVIRIGDRKFDTSIAQGLHQLRGNLRERANREIRSLTARSQSEG